MDKTEDKPPEGTVLIGTRGSALAVSQTGSVISAIERRFSGVRCEIRVIRTHGDETDKPLPEIGLTGVFTREIGKALLRGEIHLAVHSLKDLPSVMFKGTMLGAVPTREDPTDWLVSRDGVAPEGLPEGATVGTGSARRRAQLLRLRPDLRIVGARGNVDTRLRKLERGEFDALVLAASGLIRLRRNDVPHCVLSTDRILPAPGQGALGIEVPVGLEKIGGVPVGALLAAIDDQATHRCAIAERALTERLGGGCNVPLGGLCRAEGGRLILRAELLSADGRDCVAAELSGDFSEPRELGVGVAEALLNTGGDAILRELENRA
ncbi:MAG TPA: hydroxymethylbilane synthase [Candidatus Brocadiia bacterium]|nr:hydroxymethylbilane synthase [Candidatus Brocadiia bacterium]